MTKQPKPTTVSNNKIISSPPGKGKLAHKHSTKTTTFEETGGEVATKHVSSHNRIPPPLTARPPLTLSHISRPLSPRLNAVSVPQKCKTGSHKHIYLFPLCALTSPETSGKPGTTAKGGSSRCCRGSTKTLPVLKTTVCGVFSSTRKLTHFSIASPAASRSFPSVWNT